MNKTIIFGLIIISITLVGCSTIPENEREEFCKSLGLNSYGSSDGGIACQIDDEEFLKFKEQNFFGANYTNCYERKFIDTNKIPKCNEWCNEGVLYDWDSCYHSCINTWRICKQK